MDLTAITSTIRLRSKDGSCNITDEFYNTLSSSLGALLSLVGVYLLVSQAWAAHKTSYVIAFLVYGFGLLNVFTSSALHHGIDGSSRVDRMLRQWDYFSISLMIAGSFTPFCVIVLNNALGWTVLGIVWFFAILGIFLKAFYPLTPKWITTTLFILMGWLAVFIAPSIYQLLSKEALYLIVAGGLIFTLGAVVFSLERPNPVPGRFGFHEIWHLFVLGGTICHYCVMYFYLLPY